MARTQELSRDTVCSSQESLTYQGMITEMKVKVLVPLKQCWVRSSQKREVLQTHFSLHFFWECSKVLIIWHNTWLWTKEFLQDFCACIWRLGIILSHSVSWFSAGQNCVDDSWSLAEWKSLGLQKHGLSATFSAQGNWFYLQIVMEWISLTAIHDTSSWSRDFVSVIVLIKHDWRGIGWGPPVTGGTVISDNQVIGMHPIGKTLPSIRFGLSYISGFSPLSLMKLAHPCEGSLGIARAHPNLITRRTACSRFVGSGTQFLSFSICSALLCLLWFSLPLTSVMTLTCTSCGVSSFRVMGSVETLMGKSTSPSRLLQPETPKDKSFSSNMRPNFPTWWGRIRCSVCKK